MSQPRPADPVLDFICDPAVRELILQGQSGWSYSRLSASRLSKIGYKLIVLRCAQIGIYAPTRATASDWAKRS